MKPLWILGSGGHAKVVIDAALASGRFDVAGVLDDDPEHWKNRVLDIPVRGPATPEALERFGVDLAVIAIGANRARAELARQLDGLLEWATVIHPSAYLARGVKVREGSVVCAGAIVQPDATIGRHTILNTGSSVDHDCNVGNFVHIAPGVRLCGNVRIRSAAFLGVGSSVLPGLTVGAGATIGAGAVVVRDISPGATATGVPARVRIERTESHPHPGFAPQRPNPSAPPIVNCS